jgi:hypothetical protein
MTLYKIITYPFYYHKFFKIFILSWRIVAVMWPQCRRNFGAICREICREISKKRVLKHAKQHSILEIAQIANYK